MLTTHKQNLTKALHNACKALLASAFVLSFGFATQNPNPKETKPQEAKEAQETNEVAATQTPPPTQENQQDNQQESKQESQESKQEPIQTYSVPCAQDCQMQSDSKQSDSNQNESSAQSSQESTDELATQESQEQLAQEEQTRPFEIEPMNKEKSGAFVGLSIGATSLSADFSAGYFGTKDGLKNRELSISGSRGGATGIYGIMVGYKHAITGGFGLRYYADFNYISPTLAQPKMWGMNYGLNIDGLLNIVEKNDNFFGFFAGVGLGAQSYGWSDRILENDLYLTGEKGGLGDGNDNAKIQGERGDGHKNQNFKNPVTSFNVAINFGIRLNIAKHHDIELGARFRPIKHTLKEVKMEYKTGQGDSKDETHTTQQGLKAKIGSPYDIFLHYIYVF